MPLFNPREFNWLCRHIFTAKMANFLFLIDKLRSHELNHFDPHKCVLCT